MPEAKENKMADLTEKMARNIAVALNGGEFNDGKWYGEGHRTAWRNAVKPYAEEIERLRADLLEKILETLWHHYDSGIERPHDGMWTHCFMSDGEDFIAQLGLDPSLGYYDAEQVKAAIPAAAVAALLSKGKLP